MSFVRLRIRTCASRLLLLAVFAVLQGCATTEFVKVRERPRNPLAERLSVTRLGIARPSQRTHAFLTQTGFRETLHLRPMLEHASRYRRSDRQFDALHALAELNYLAAQSSLSHDSALASELFLDSAHAAWDYFSTPLNDGRLPDPMQAEHRETAEIYNTSSESLLRIARGKGSFRLGQSLSMPLTRRQLHFEIPFASRLLTPSSLGDFEFVTDYQLKNLRNCHVTHGLGVPLIANRQPPRTPDPMEEHYPRGMAFAATIVLRFLDPTTCSDAACRTMPVSMEAYDPRDSDGLVVRDTLMPLETDVSTPLAKYLSNPDLSLLDTWGLIRPDRTKKIQGLYMVQPWDPDRIPVVMVHGLWSSPMTWMEMFNDLQADPEIRRRYQFWFYLYPSGEPLTYAAADLRDELRRIRDDVDPHRDNSSLDNTVIVGHSMGGLISHLMTIDSGDALWNSVSRRPIDELQATPDDKNEIRRVFFFQPERSIHRVITIATPYGGSRLSNSFTQWLGNAFIWLPTRTNQLSRLIEEQNGPDWKDRLLPPRTSVDSLAKKSAVLKLVRETACPPEVPHHNIVGVRKGSSLEDWTDGIVMFRSAHQEQVASERVVHAGHSEIVRHPEAIREVRRILLLHLEEVHQRQYPVTPVSHGTTSRVAPQKASSTLTP